MKRVGRTPKVEEGRAKPKGGRASPARSPGRPRKDASSPARKAASPARKASPGRKASPARRASPARKAASPPRSPKKSPGGVKVEQQQPRVLVERTKNGIDSNKQQDNKEKESRTLRERKPKLADYSAAVRRTRASRDDDFDRLLRLAQTTELPSGRHDLSDGDDDLPESRKLSTPHDLKHAYGDFGGPLSAISNTVFGFGLLVAANVACSAQACTFAQLPDFRRYAKLNSWVTPRSFALASALYALLALLSLVPFFGARTALPGGRHSFVPNGLFSLLVIAGIAFGVERFYYPVTSVIYEDYVQLEIASVAIGVVLAIAMLIRGERVPREQRNPNANTGSRVYDFVMGCEIQPVLFGRLPIKVLLIRFALVGLILVNVTWIYNDMTIKNFPPLTYESLLESATYAKMINAVSLSPTLFLFASMQIAYALHPLVFESHLVSTFDHMYEGVGLYLCVACPIYPFFPSLITKRILDHDIAYPSWALAAAALLFLVGFYVFHASNVEKNTFRRNPLDPKVAHLQTLPTFQGKKLLVSGWWGSVRHPNYAGDLLLHAAWAVGAHNGLPLYVPLLTFFILFDRTRRDGKRCSERYGIAWRRYCQKVPYCLVPKVY